MEPITIKFAARGQRLSGHALRIASGPVNAIKAEFDLDSDWQSFDVLRAVWTNGHETITMVLDENYSCMVPHEVLAKRGRVDLNLVATKDIDDVLSMRTTTYQAAAIFVDVTVPLSGTETTEITPNQFDQYVENVADMIDGKMAEIQALIDSIQVSRNISELVNDVGYITMGDLPVYDGSVV